MGHFCRVHADDATDIRCKPESVLSRSGAEVDERFMALKV
jgi:hypothetical protein